jgi:hypothetical protein
MEEGEYSRRHVSMTDIKYSPFLEIMLIKGPCSTMSLKEKN